MTAGRFSLAACLLATLATPSLADPSALVELARARMGTLEPIVTAFGTLAADPNAQTTLAVPRDGIVVSVVVRAGKLVGKGDPIATIATAPAATAQFEQAKSAMAFTQKDLDHTRTLFSEQLATRSTLAAAEKAYADARSVFVHEQRIGADKMTETLTASLPGVVTNVAVSPGDHVSAGAAIASIAARDHMVLDLGLEPQDAAHLAPGAKVIVTSAQDPTLNFATRVASVDVMLDPQSRLVEAVVAIAPDVSRQLILGMSLKARIVLPTRRGILIPKSALMTDEQGTFVYVVQNDHAHRRDISIGLETGNYALIARGLAPKEVVVAVGGAGLNDGMLVRVR